MKEMTEMAKATVTYHREGTSWWAESPDVPGFSAVGDSIEEVRNLVGQGLPFYLDGEVELVEELAGGAKFSTTLAKSLPRPTRWWTETQTRATEAFTAATPRPYVQTRPLTTANAT